MYNGIGLQTARGSGTNGYVQRNMSFVPKTKAKVNYRNEEELQKLDAITNRKPNEGILAHERKRVIELKCLELQELMEADGYAEEEINSKVSMLRKMLLEKDDDAHLQTPKDAFGRPIVKESHQMAEANQEKNMKMREALGISQYFVEGSSMDPERKTREAAAAAAAAEAQKSYSLVPASSSSSLERESEKDKSKKKKSNANKRSEESVSHKKKKLSKRSKRERSESVEVRKKHRQKKASRDKGKHKRDKHKHREDPSSSGSSDDSGNSSELDSSSSSESNVSRSSSLARRSSSKDDRSPSVAKTKKKKDHMKQPKKHRGKKPLKTHSGEESVGHAKSRRSRRDKYEASKKKTVISKGTSKARSVSSSSSSDAESSTEQYYRLEPVFVKSKSKHKKDVQLIEVQSKKKSRHDKYSEKKKKRLRVSSSSSSTASTENEASKPNKKKRRISSSPALLVKRTHERTKTGSKKHHKKHRSSSSDAPSDGRCKKSMSRSLSYSPIPNSRSGGQNASKKSSSSLHGHNLHKEIIVSGNKLEAIYKEKGHSKSSRVNSKRGKDKHAVDSSESDTAGHFHRSRSNANHAAHGAGKHNGCQKSRSRHSNVNMSPKPKKRHDSPLSRSEDENAYNKKGTKNRNHSKRHSSPSCCNQKIAEKISPSDHHRVRHKNHYSSASDSNICSVIKAAVKKKKDKQKEVKRKKQNSSSSSSRGDRSSRSRSKSIPLKSNKPIERVKEKKKHGKKRSSENKYQVLAISPPGSRSNSESSYHRSMRTPFSHAKSRCDADFVTKVAREKSSSPLIIIKLADERNCEMLSNGKSASQTPVSGNFSCKSPSFECNKEIQHTHQDSKQSPNHQKIKSDFHEDDRVNQKSHISSKSQSFRNSFTRTLSKDDKPTKHSRSPSGKKLNRSRSRSLSSEPSHNNYSRKHERSCSPKYSRSPLNHKSCAKSKSPTRCENPSEKRSISSFSPVRCNEKIRDSCQSPNSPHASPTKVEKSECEVQRISPVQSKSPKKMSETKSDQNEKSTQNLPFEKSKEVNRSSKKDSRSVSGSPHRSRRSRSRSSTHSDRRNTTLKSGVGGSRESSCSSSRRKSKNKSKSFSESKSRSRSRSITRSRSRSYSPSRSRSRTKSSRSRARSISGHRRRDSRSYSRSPSRSYYDRSSSSSNFSRVYRR